MHYYFITGSSKGLGLALVKLLLQKEDTFVVGLSRSNKLQHDRFIYKNVDLSDIKRLSKRVEDIFLVGEKAVSITLINNAGTLGEVGYMGELDNKKLPEIYNINLIAPALLMNAFIEKFKDNAATKLIVNISSGAGSYPVDGWSGYCASKSGINMLSEVISTEQALRKSNIKIFSIAPGVVDTEMQGKIRNTSSQRFSGVEKFVNLKEKGELASAEDAAAKILQILQNSEKYKEVMQDVRNIKG